MTVTAVMSVDARSGNAVREVAQETTHEAVDAACRRAAAAAPALEALGRTGRAALLRAMADALRADRDNLVELADRETALGTTRLNGELTRTCFQLELFADVVVDGGYLEATIDHPAETGMGPRPDLRRMLLPLGPVGVFGASNFPFAFSVPGGDTTAALAAGCPAVIKAHPSHPDTSQACFAALRAGAATAGAPDSSVELVHGEQAGTAVVAHPVIKAVGFTGSLRGGRALFDIACARPDPIPFYGELGSINPLVVTPVAASERADAIAEGLVGSFTLGVGQFCTKPGLAFIPADEGGERVRSALVARVHERGSAPMLNAGIRDAFSGGAQRLARADGVDVAAGVPNADGHEAAPVVFVTNVAELPDTVLEECFGPSIVLVRYASEAELFDALGRIEGSLTASVHCGTGETDLPERLSRMLAGRAGRLVWNGFPTGVAVSWAMNHGGPWPATTNQLHTSVGVSAIRRFLRPVCWQDAPATVLPAELRDGPVDVPRRVDGELRLPPSD